MDNITGRWCGEEGIIGIDRRPHGPRPHVSLVGDAAARMRCNPLQEERGRMPDGWEEGEEDPRPVCEMSAWWLLFEPHVEQQYMWDSALRARTVR